MKGSGPRHCARLRDERSSHATRALHRSAGREARGVGASVRQVKVGDQVLFSPEDQHEVEVHGEDLIILRERDVHAVAAERIEEATGLYL